MEITTETCAVRDISEDELAESPPGWSLPGGCLGSVTGWAKRLDKKAEDLSRRRSSSDWGTVDEEDGSWGLCVSCRTYVTPSGWGDITINIGILREEREVKRTLMSVSPFTESSPSSFSFTQVSQSFGFAPKFFFLEVPGVSPGWRKISSKCSCNCSRYRLLSKNDRRTIAVETTRSRKRVDKNVNLRNVSSNLSFLRSWRGGREDVQIE